MHASDARGRTPRRAITPPPRPTVEDGDDDDADFAHERPKCPGDADQHPLIMDNKDYINHNEQRFVLVSNPAEKPAGRNGRTERAGRSGNEPADRGRQVEKGTDSVPNTPPRRLATPTVTEPETLNAGAAAAAAVSGGTRRRPSTHGRARSRADLPRIDTDMYGPREKDSRYSRSRSSAPMYEADYRYNVPRSPDRPSRFGQDDFLGPEVIKSGRNREEFYYDSGRGPHSSRYSERPSSSSRRRDDAYYNTGYLETAPTVSRTKLEPELRSARESRRSSPRAREEPVIVPEPGFEDLSAFYPDLSPRRREPRPRRYTNQYSGDESDTSSLRRSGRRPIVIQTDGRPSNVIPPDDARYPESRPRRRTNTVSSRHNGYRDSGPRGPRSPNPSAQKFDSASATPPYPVEDLMPSQDRPGYLEPDYWDPGVGPRGPQGPTTMPMRVPAPSGPRESRPGSRGQSTSRSWQSSPPKPRGIWQDNISTTGYLPPGPRQPDITVRGYFEDPRRLGLPHIPKCERKETVPGKTDWLTLADGEHFTICPDCYNKVFSKSPEFRQYFKPFLPQDPKMKLCCDFGASPWYVVAWLMSLKNGFRDHRLFLEVSRIATDYTKTEDACPGDERALRLWHSVYDPATGRALPDFNICRECTQIMGALMPNLKGILMTQGTDGRAKCSLRRGADIGEFLLNFDAFERASDEAEAEGRPVSEGRLADDLTSLARPMTCLRDKPVRNAMWYTLSWLPELTVCGVCYEDAACPALRESARSADKFGMHLEQLKEGTCQLYSERMRDVFREACRRGDKNMLWDAVIDRIEKESDFSRLVDSLERVGDTHEIEKLREIRKAWE